MEHNLLQKLQRVKIKDVLHIFMFLIALPLSLFLKCKRKHMWLICDNEQEARDNGYWLYYYIKQNEPSCDAVYAINTKSPDYAKVKDLGEVVSYGSLKHWIYYLAAEVNISSQKGGKPNAAVCYVLEVYGLLKNTRVFLQHGITKDKMDFLYYERTKMSMFVCATKRETEFVESTFGYPEGAVQELGFCRFDHLIDESSGKRQILVMPTWRNWIGRKTSLSKEMEDTSDFKNTVYYKNWSGFLANPKLYELLEQYDLNLVFYPHRDMQEYLDYFVSEHPRLTIAGWPTHDVQTLLKESNLLVTDYSSIAMDFAYMEKPLLYYQFDYDMFRRGHYSSGYFDYVEDGFGEVVRSQDELFASFEKLLKNEFKQDFEYVRRSREFFDLKDSNSSMRNYEAIKRMLEKRSFTK